MSHPDWLHWFATCPSTNTWALAHCAALHHGDVVFTPQQTAGRGQWGRQWVAPAGVLTASFILRELPIVQLPYCSLLAGLVVIQVLEQSCPALSDQLQLKWPNDVWLAGRKLAGILSETPPRRGDMADVVVGIGLNRRVDFGQSELGDRAISLHQMVVDVPAVMTLLVQLRSGLLRLATAIQARPPQSNLSQTWVRSLNQRDLLRDRTVTAVIGGVEIVGTGLGMDWQGGYQLRLPSGEVRSLTTGQILRWQ